MKGLVARWARVTAVFVINASMLRSGPPWAPRIPSTLEGHNCARSVDGLAGGDRSRSLTRIMQVTRVVEGRVAPYDRPLGQGGRTQSNRQEL